MFYPLIKTATVQNISLKVEHHRHFPGMLTSAALFGISLWSIESTDYNQIDMKYLVYIQMSRLATSL